MTGARELFGGSGGTTAAYPRPRTDARAASMQRPTVVEFAGPSGAGKTRLVQRLRMHSDARCPMLHASDLIMDRLGRRHITNPKLMNVIADFTVLPSFLRGLDRHGDFMRFAFERLHRYARSRFERYNYMREVVRDVGLQGFARRATPGTAVVVDEGAVLTASHLFVYNDGPLASDALGDFARLVPLPDVVVYVRAPVEVLVDRAVRRPDRRRELRAADRREMERWAKRALEVFDRLTATARLREHVFTVDVEDTQAHDEDAAARRIAAFISERHLSSPRFNPDPTRSHHKV